MNKKLVLTLAVMSMSSALLQGVTIDASLANLAEIDIVISKNAMPPLSIASEFFSSSSRVIAGYSFLLNSDNTISLWQRLYSGSGLTTFLLPANRFMRPLQRDNPFTIELSPEEIQTIVGQAISQVSIRILQRTYEWNSATNRLQFFAYNVLTETTYSVAANISLNASGLIACEKLDTVPPALQDIYTVASGSVS